MSEGQGQGAPGRESAREAALRLDDGALFDVEAVAATGQGVPLLRTAERAGLERTMELLADHAARLDAVAERDAGLLLRWRTEVRRAEGGAVMILEGGVARPYLVASGVRSAALTLAGAMVRRRLGAEIAHAERVLRSPFP